MTTRNISTSGMNGTVTINPADGQTQESIDQDFRRSEELMEKLQRRNVQYWRCDVKPFGPFKYAITKEVGPPPWKFPRLLTKVARTPWHIMIGCGWRSTAYTFHLFRGKKS